MWNKLQFRLFWHMQVVGEHRLRRLAFTTARNELHQELNAYSFDARQSKLSYDTSSAPPSSATNAENLVRKCPSVVQISEQFKTSNLLVNVLAILKINTGQP